MKMESIAYRLGSRVVSNEEILEKVKSCSSDIHEGDLNKTLNQIQYYFDQSGIKTRRCVASNETPIDLVCEAISAALDKAGMVKKDIQLLIHVGLSRGFMEAGQAYFVAQAAELNRVHCFDIMDACNSWTRGVFIAYNFLRNKVYDRIMIVNTECNFLEGGTINPALFYFKNFEQVYYSFAGLTFGDGVSATVLTSDDTNDWDFEFISRPDLAELCAVPVDNYKYFSKPSPKIGVNGANHFYAYMREMQKEMMNDTINICTNHKTPIADIDWIFPHGHSKNVWLKYGPLGNWKPEKMKWNTYEYIGNLASASVPVSIAMGIESGEVKEGHKLLTCVPSGGMSISKMIFTL